MSRLILFGPDGGGKSSLAKELEKEGYEVRAYATQIKEVVHKMHGREPINREDKEANFREDYIKVGERAKETHGEKVWAELMSYEGGDVVIDDARFLVEYDKAVLDEGFHPIYVDYKGRRPEGYELKEIYEYCSEHLLSPEDIEEFLDGMRVVEEKKPVIDVTGYIALIILILALAQIIQIIAAFMKVI